jgi:DNA polymerase-1
LKNYGRVHDLDELKKFAAKLIEGDRPVGFDIETGYEGEDRKKASLHPEESIVVGFSFSNDARWARYAPLAHDAADNLDPHEAAEVWWPVLQQCKVVAHNAKFELRCMALWFLEHLSDHPVLGEEVRAKRGWFPIFSDTMIESYVDGREKTHGLKDVTLGIFGHEMMHIQELFKDMKIKMDCLRFNILPLSEEVIAYACEDAAWCLAIHELLYPGVKDQRVYQIDMKLIPILTEMEEVGLVYDWPAMRKSAAELTGFLERLNAEILQDLSVQCGEQITINLGSAPQVGEVLYKKLKMPVIRKTPKGAPSTDEKAITGLSKQFPVVRRILDWRELTVLQTRYLIGFEKQYGFADDGRVHASHAQTTVAGGRFAVSEPNYQQSANRYYQELRDGDSYECKFRQFLIVPKGTYMFGFDYSQIELRMTAGVSREPAMLESFRTDIDVHAATAGAMFGISPDKVTKEQRQAGKQFNFALLYGQGVKATAEILGISHAEAQDLYDRYFAGFPTLKVWTQRAVDVGRQQGYVTNIFGRKIVIWDYESRENWIMAKGDRLCVNAQIQGSAADYMRIAMIRVDAFLTEKGLRDKVKLVMNIHDALEFYVA